MIKSFISLALLYGLVVPSAFAQGEDLLESDQAFQFNAELVANERLDVSWIIADDYYMYRDKIRVRLISGEAELGAPVLPAGKKKQDEIFGEVETYTQQLHYRIPVVPTSDQSARITVEFQGQGCNEPIGVCYPPITHRRSFVLPAPGPTVNSTSDGNLTLTDQPAALQHATGEKTINSLQALGELLGVEGSESRFLESDQAFRLSLITSEQGQLLAHFTIADGYYLYKDKIQIASTTAGVSVGELELPPAEFKEDEYFGKMEVFHRSFDATAQISALQTTTSEAEFSVAYQGCADQGICYPPIKKLVTLVLPAAALANNAARGDGAITTSKVLSNAQKSAGSGQAVWGAGWWGYIVTAFLTGLALAFTPCVLPMIPILTSIIVGNSGDQVTKFKSGMLALVYVLGTAVTYGAIGYVAGATGEQLQAYFQNPWAIGIFATVLVLMALSMFGVYELQMPSFVQSRVQEKTQALSGGSIGIVFVLGLMSALIVGACVSPLLITALGVAIKAGDPALGVVIMVAMALGMGVLLVAVGFGAGSLLPHAGSWMEKVNYVFGVLLIAVAIYLLSILQAVPVLYLWAALLIISSIYLGALQSLPDGSSGWHRLFKGVGVVMLIWGVLALIGAMSGNRDVLRPVNLSQLGSSSHQSTSAELPSLFTRVNDLDQLNAEFARAQAAGKLVMLDYYADWCSDCVRMEKTTFHDAEVRNKIKDTLILLQVDVTDTGNASTRALKKHYGVYGPPAMLFFDHQGQEREGLRRYGYLNPSQFLDHIAELTRS